MSQNDIDPNDPFGFFTGNNDKKNNNKKPKKNGQNRVPIWTLVGLFFLLLFVISQLFASSSQTALIPFSEFKDRIERGEIKYVEMGQVYFLGYVSVSQAETANEGTGFSLFGSSVKNSSFRTVGVLSDDFLKLLDEKKIIYSIKVKERSFLLEILQWIFPFILIFGFFTLMMRRISKNMGGGLGGGVFSQGQSAGGTIVEGKVDTRFSDVAGVDEAKEELVEVVDFLKNPKKYTEIGGKIPRGVLLVGPPGTGKTLLARAVAGESGTPFFKISGSEFVEMFVGVGASRVRKLFKEAREKAPCIVFIDELDAIGKSRINSINSNDEREQTLNQLLVEMDGFDATSGLIVLAATNRPDVLDPAILRPGRFDRQIVVDRPDVRGREQILKIHAKQVKMEENVDLNDIAKMSSGFSGADLANVINEAALMAVRSGRKLVNMDDLHEAVEKNIAGLQRKSRVIKEKERRIVAYHETGHAVVAAFTKGAEPVHKISIIPRGIAALGYTLHIPEEDNYLHTRAEMIAEVDVLLSGRAAEDIIFGEVSTGAGNDIMRATDIINKMLTDYGMSEKFRNVALTQRGGGYFSRRGEPSLEREYSESTQEYLDTEIARIIDERYRAVLELLNSKRDIVEYIANRLLEKEVIEKAEFDEIIKYGSEGALSRLEVSNTVSGETENSEIQA
ncbi:MAG: ATP-dependent zinc metalloprotease FtsH [Spirochaetaceae bacterium]|nr:ATP-dependent zinc metalloprotease FtsH [Spirochaetaceae bacterium]